MGMKYRDPNTQQLKELSLKAADTLPIGTIVDYDGEDAPEGWEEYGTDDYSIEETFTGKHWINGKPIYQKTILVNSLPASADIVAYNHNVNNMELGWFDLSNCFIEFNLSQENHFTVPLPYNNYTGNSIFLFDLDASSFKIKTTQDRSNLKAYVTIRYTKTTD